jgi:hypothetical protein
MREAALEREHEQDAKRRAADIAEKRRHPPDARAPSVAAAVISDGFVADALELRLRDNIVGFEDGRERLFPEG